MAKSIFSLNMTLINKKESILSISERVINTFYLLSLSDSIFGNLKVIAQPNGFYKPIILSSNNQDCINELSEAILDYSLSDIRSSDGIDYPNTDYSRSYGFTFAINFSNLITLTFKMGSSESNGIGTISFSKSMTKDFVWYFTLLKGMSEGFKTNYSKIGFIETPFNKNCKSYKFPLGWITFFSNDYETPIPNDLQGIEYEHTEKGKYLILTREDFTTDKEIYEMHKQKLLDIMEEIKRRVPEYGK